ncbi:MAG: TadE/TadG family type IV pilus assembly protein [Anaerolineae bacterium]|jgi:hypothetical protein|nr:TadE/TadG family type IV pilus assembly protein [Anaerolineae bacterium]
MRQTTSEQKVQQKKKHFLIVPKEQRRKGQSLIEMALIVPILLIMVLGLVEVAAFMGAYLDALDLVREAARFASLRDPFYVGPTDMNCSTEAFDYYYDTVCIFSPPAGDARCTIGDPFCNGVNSATTLDMTRDDIVISAYTVVDQNVTATYPPPDGYYAYSDHDSDTVNNGNWQKNCEGDVVRFTPYFTAAKMNSYLSPNAPPKRAFVAVEYYYCYEQMLKAPVLYQIMPEVMRIHVYTVISLPAAIPTSTPYQTPTP